MTAPSTSPTPSPAMASQPLPKNQRSLLRTSAVPAVGTALSRVSGLVRVAALTAALGLTSIADIYNLANTAPNILYELVIGGVLSSTLVPLFIKGTNSEDDDSISVMVTVSFVAIAVLTFVAVLAAPLINWFFALSVEGAERSRQLTIGRDLLFLLFPQVFFYGITTIATAVLHSRRRFAAPAFAPVLTNIVISAAALGVYMLQQSNPDASESQSVILLLGAGTTAGIAAMAAALIPAIRRSGVHLRWRFQPRHPAIKAILKLSGWTVGFAIANQVALLIILTMARGSGTGAVSAYQYAFIFFQLPYGLIAVSIMTAVLPELASESAENNHDGFRNRFYEGLGLLATLMIPAAGAYLILAQPLVELLLQRGQFDAAAVHDTAQMLRGFSIGLPTFALFLYIVRSFHATRNTRVPFYLNLFKNVLNVALVLPLVALLNAPGLSIAYSIAYVVGASMAFIALHRHVGDILNTEFFKMMISPLCVGAVVIISIWLVQILLGTDQSPLLLIGVSLVVALPVFVGCLFVFRPRGFETLVAKLSRMNPLSSSRG